MKRLLRLIAVATMSIAMVAPTLAFAQSPEQRQDQRRHDQKANQGFSTNRDTTSGYREGGYVRYSMSNAGNSRLARSSEEAEKQHRRGEDAYAAGNYGSACMSFKHAKNLYARIGDTQMSEASATLAQDACTMARANSSGPGRAYRSG